jgi:hypothetical protein
LRKIALLVMAAAALGVVAFAGPAGAASGGGCQLQGSGSFTPGLGATAKNFTYSFAGALTGCNSTAAGSPTSGTVEAGKTVAVEQPTLDANGVPTGGTHTVHYQEPVPTGNGGCTNSTTAGIAIAKWADGTVTVIKYSTSGAAAAVALTGSVQNSVTLNATDAQTGDPSTLTITSTRYVGQNAGGPLAFQPPDPTACNAPSGVTTAGISGFVGLGTQN